MTVTQRLAFLPSGITAEPFCFSTGRVRDIRCSLSLFLPLFLNPSPILSLFLSPTPSFPLSFSLFLSFSQSFFFSLSLFTRPIVCQQQALKGQESGVMCHWSVNYNFSASFCCGPCIWEVSFNRGLLPCKLKCCLYLVLPKDNSSVLPPHLRRNNHREFCLISS